MRAMILAAGRGERLRPLTDQMPKPLIEVGGQPLILRHLRNLASAGFSKVVVNVSHLGHQIEAAVEGEVNPGLEVTWSREPEGALETGGGIQQAMKWLGDQPFAVINGDIFTDYPFRRLRAVKCDWAHLVLVPNPDHNPDGDFALEGARLRNEGDNRGTFSGIAVYHPRLFAACAPGRYSVVPLIRTAVDQNVVTGELHQGTWSDVGTPDRLEAIRSLIRNDTA